MTVVFNEPVAVDEGLRWKHRRPGANGGKGKVLTDGQEGWGIGGDGVRRFKRRIIDVAGKRYREFVKLFDGTIVRDVDEDLTKHVPAAQQRGPGPEKNAPPDSTT